ncbi:MAG TPA: ATP-grasp domain-containing protein [Phycisphaerales bacterium]|nr:ATP-grasp domain-containing protein [Phycisphaerales bacterium]
MENNIEKSNTNCDVLVGYAWCRSSYAAIRSLSRLGLRVATVDTTKFGMGQCSRYTTAHFVHANPQSEPEQFIADIANILSQCQAHFYMPGHDEGEVVAKYRDRLPNNVMIPLTDYETIVRANDKMCSAQLAMQLNIPTAPIIKWENISELKDAIDNTLTSVVIKLRRGCGAKGVYYSKGKEEIIAIVEKIIKQYNLSPKRYPIVQKRVTGEGWGVSCLYWQGERIASFTHRRIREKTITGGTSTLRESASNPEMESYAHKMLDYLKWHGLAMVEFKWDPKTEQAWFIEINPRLWGSIALPIACGVDFPAMTYFAATNRLEKARKMVKDYKDSIVARWYLGDLILSVSLLAKMQPLKAAKLLMPGKEDIFDDICNNDIRATVSEFVSYFIRFLKYRSTNPVDKGELG